MQTYANQVGNATVSHTIDTRNPDRDSYTLSLCLERIPRGFAQALRREYGDHERINNGGDTEFIFKNTTRPVIDSIIKLASTLDADCCAHVIVSE